MIDKRVTIALKPIGVQSIISQIAGAAVDQLVAATLEIIDAILIIPVQQRLQIAHVVVGR